MTTTANPLVSVLTPFYNEAPYLRQCIESVLAQTYPNFEYLLVDNASTDGSNRIAEEYAARDSRVRLISRNQHVAISENLNHAAAAAAPAAKYIKYCFGDDWLYPECLAQMLLKLETNPQVGSVCAYTLIGDEVYPYGPRYDESVLSGREAARRYLLSDRPMFGTVTASMFRAEVVRERTDFFNPLRIADDIEIELASFLSWNFAFVHQVLSFTRRERPSNSTKMTRLVLLQAGPLICLHKYGATFLEPHELRTRYRLIRSRYGRDLAAGMLRSGFSELLRVHRQELANSGVPFPTRNLLIGLIYVAGQALRHPIRGYQAFRRERTQAT